MGKKFKPRALPGTKQSVECLLCARRYSEIDILEGRYWLETMVCSECYADMQKKPHELSCFGKPTWVNYWPHKKLLGWWPESEECSLLCPDRKVCARIMRSSKTG